MKSFLIIAVSILAAVPLFADEQKAAIVAPAEEFPNAIGVFGSSAPSGVFSGGISYQRWFGTFGFAVTAGGMALPVAKATGNVSFFEPGIPYFMTWSYNAEVDLLLKLYPSNFWDWLSGDLYLYGALAHRGSVDRVYVSDPNGDQDLSDSYQEAGAFRPVFSVGLGIGYEITLFRHFAFQAQFGYAVEIPLCVGFVFSGGIRYRF